MHMDAQDQERSSQILMEIMFVFDDVDGNNETYTRTTKFGDLRMLIFRCVFHQS